jgi:hypothetical protein
MPVGTLLSVFKHPVLGCLPIPFVTRRASQKSDLCSLRPEGVDFGSGQGRSAFGTGGVAALRRGFQKHENTGLGRKMPFLDEVFL